MRRNLRRVSSKSTNNRRLYESIMRDVAKTVKRHLNEYEYTVDLDDENISNTYNIDQTYDEQINIIFDNSGSMWKNFDYMWDILYNRLKVWKQNKKNILFNFYYITNMSKPIQIDLLGTDSLIEKLQDIADSNNTTGGSDIYNVIKKMGKTNIPTWILTDTETIYDIPYDKINKVYFSNLEFWLFGESDEFTDGIYDRLKTYNLNYIEYEH